MPTEDSKREREIAQRDYLELMQMIEGGDTGALELAAGAVEGFPLGTDGYLGRHWITHAVDRGTPETVEWMIRKGVDLNFRDSEGYSPIHSCIERDRADRHRILDLLLKAGADPDTYGIHDWTPLHMAAIRDDETAMRMLLEAGADPTRRTRIDGYATPEEEARQLGHDGSAEFLKSYRPATEPG